MIQLKGKPVADSISEDIAGRITKLYENNIVPTLAIVRVGDNPGDVAYENGAIKRAKALGMQVEKYICPADMEDDDLVLVIESINNNSKIHGILLLQPLPAHMDADKVRNAICKEKDVDCISDASLCDFFLHDDYAFSPCTAESAMRILNHYDVDIAGKKAVVIGRSMVIGRPAALMLMRNNASVTVCHSKTPAEDLANYCREADIIVTAAGMASAVTAEMLTGKQIVVDVGINFDEEEKMIGDADFAGIEEADAAHGITPVPGGVGSVTNTVLMEHLLEAALRYLDKVDAERESEI